jgi:hypothetical protein
MNKFVEKRPLFSEPIIFSAPKNLLAESIRRGSPLELKGILQRADAKNHNGRTYPFEILKREAVNYEENFINQNRAYGELDHPDSSVVELKNACHRVTEMHWEGKDLIGTCRILPTPNGDILKAIILDGGTVGISSRGLGSVKEIQEGMSTVVEVQDDFELIGFDFVSNPSTHGAFMSPDGTNSLNESVTRTNGLVVPNNIYHKAETLIRDILGEIGHDYK